MTSDNSNMVKVSKYLGAGSLAKKGDEFVVTVKAKATAACTIFAGIRNCDSSDTSEDWRHPRNTLTMQISNDFAEYTTTLVVGDAINYTDNALLVFYLYVPDTNVTNVTIDEIVVRKKQPAVNSGLIMDGDFEATEQLDQYSYNNGISTTLDAGKWYSSNANTVTVENDAEHCNYISMSNQGRIAQKLPNVKQNDGVVITFKAKWDVMPNENYNQFWFYVAPASVAHAYAFRGCIPLSEEWKEYTIIYNPEGESSAQVSLNDTKDYSTEEFVFLLYCGNQGGAVSVDDVRVDSLDPFASNDLGDAQLTGVSMRGQSGTLPTAIRWKNAIRKDFADN